MMDHQPKLLWSQVLEEKGDFITNIKHFPAVDIYILIHDKPCLNIMTDISGVHQLLNQPKQSLHLKTLQFQSPIYDALAISDCILVSNCNMPEIQLRLYKRQDNGQKITDWATIFDKKPNSECYLVPLQIAKNQETVIGGGKKFVSLYDLTKLCIKTRLKSMMKRYVSSVELISEFEAVLGQFNGQISFVDLRSQQAATTWKPHVDLVTRIKGVPHSPNQFISLARKDNYSYLWDNRNLSTFVRCFEQPLFQNQRTGLDVSKKGQMVLLGNQRGQISAKSLLTGQHIFTHKSNLNYCVGSICALQDRILASIGSRTFNLKGQAAQSANIVCLAI